MRILHTIDSAGIYGAESVLLTLAGEQQRQGHSPTLLSVGNSSAAEKALESEARRRGLACIAHRMRDGLNLGGAVELLRIAEQQEIDVIHSHGYKTDILLGMSSRAARGRPLVTTLHGWTAKSTWSKLGLYRALDQLMLHRMDAVVVVSERLKSALAVRMLGDKLSLIANGIPVGDAPAPTGMSGDPLHRSIADLRQRAGFVVGAIGRLSPEKNFVMLIDALQGARARGANLGVVLLGEGPERGAVEAAITRHGLGDYVMLAGYVPEARRYLGSFDLLAIPSLTEGLPITLLEAMSENLPVLATRVGDIPATLAELGTLIPPGDVRALADALHRIATDPQPHRKAAEGGFARIRDKFSARTMFDRYDSVYGRVVARR